MITGAAGILGAAIPQVSMVLREIRQAERDRQEASSLVKEVEASVVLENNVVVARIDIGQLDTLIAAFRAEAVRCTRGLL